MAKGIEVMEWRRTVAARIGLRRGALALALGVLLSSGCGSDDTAKDDTAASADSADIAADAAGSDTAIGGDSADTGGGEADTVVDVTPPKEDFWVLYSRRNKIPGSTDNDLVLTGKDNPGAVTNASTYGMGISPIDGKGKALLLTKYSFKNAGGLTCEFGCVLSDNLKYIAIATGAPNAKGYTYALGTLNDSLQVFVGKFGQLEDVADLHFSGSKLYYSKARNCFDTGKCQYEIRLRMMDGSAEEKMLTVMAPDNDPDILDTKPHTTYTGRFQVSENGETLVFLTTTIRSVKVWAWRGGNVYQMDYICEHPLDNNTCVGTGSQYHDNDAVGISPDGKVLVLFTVVDRSLRVRRYDIGSTSAPVFSNLVTVPAGTAYLQSVCLNLESWQHAEVRGKPQFSADGKTVYFLGWSDCAGSKEKVWTDILSIQVDAIGQTINKADLTNYTKNPRDISVENLWIRDLNLSPEKKYFVFNASPLWSTTGDPASGQRLVSDTEVYTMPAQLGGKPLQITNEVSYATDTPQALLPVKVP